MRALTLLLSLFVSTVGFAQGAAAPIAAPLTIDGHVIEAPQAILDGLYANSTVLGFANADHDQPDTHLALMDFLRVHGLDPALKSIVVEIPHDFLAYFEKASATEPTTADIAAIGDWTDYLQVAEPAFVATQLLPLVREINKKRTDPLIVVPIDSIQKDNFWGLILQPGETPDLRVPVDPSKADWAFIDSLDREQATAANFLKFVRLRWPGRKTLIVYQHAHLLRNLSAWGATRASGQPQMIDGPLSWADLVAAQDTTFAREYKIALFDRQVGWNPDGAIAGDEQLAAKVFAATQATDFGFKLNSPAVEAVSLVPGSFLAKYRNGSIRPTTPTLSIADAIIWTKPK